MMYVCGSICTYHDMLLRNGPIASLDTLLDTLLDTSLDTPGEIHPPPITHPCDIFF